MVKSKILITGGLGFIGSNLAKKLVENGNEVTLVDSLIPEHGGNKRNINGIKNLVQVNLSDVRDPFSINELVKNKIFFSISQGRPATSTQWKILSSTWI